MFRFGRNSNLTSDDMDDLQSQFIAVYEYNDLYPDNIIDYMPHPE